MSSNTASWSCGGVYLGYYSDATLSNNIISANIANAGSGVFLSYHSHAIMSNNVIADNQANVGGSGLHMSGSSAHLLHTTIACNIGGAGSGIYITNDGSIYSTVLLSNTIIVSQSVGITITSGNTMVVNGILWYGTPVTVSQATTATVAVQNQHGGNPTFAADGYHLLAGSAAIDTGVDAGVDTDIEGDVRPQGSGFDLGADESLLATLVINYASGKPGSFLTLTGSNFPPNNTATVAINGHTLASTITVDTLGSFVFLLDTSQADPGRYFVTATVNPSASTSFTLDPSAPLHPQEGSGPVLNVPSGIAFNRFIYLPLVVRSY